MSNWVINADNLSLGGFSPGWYRGTVPSYGNANQAATMSNIDLSSPSYIAQGPGLASLTNGTESGVVSTLIQSILNYPPTTGITYAVGGNKLYQLSSTTVTNGSSGITFPHTITHSGSELGEDVAFYQGNLYYSYNEAGSVGNVGFWTPAAGSATDNWWTATLGATALTSNPHQMVVGGDDVLYIANGRYVANYNGSTGSDKALNLPIGSIIQSIAWLNDRLYILANNLGLTGVNRLKSSIYIWDGQATSWETEIKMTNRVGGSHVKNGILYFFYEDISQAGVSTLAYLSGNTIVNLAYSKGTVGNPTTYYQITEYKDFILWISGTSIYAWGSGDKDVPVRYFQMANAGYTTPGGLSSPFGTPMIASSQSSSFKLAQFSGFDTTSTVTFTSINYDITGDGLESKLNRIRVNFDVLQTGASVKLILWDEHGNPYIDIISYAKLGASRSTYFNLNGKVITNFYFVLDYADSVTNTVRIRGIRFYGTTS